MKPLVLSVIPKMLLQPIMQLIPILRLSMLLQLILEILMLLLLKPTTNISDLPSDALKEIDKE
jgi:hypothetical protein